MFCQLLESVQGRKIKDLRLERKLFTTLTDFGGIKPFPSRSVTDGHLRTGDCVIMSHGGQHSDSVGCMAKIKGTNGSSQV